MMHLLTPKALSFRRPNSTASYSAVLFVVRNYSLAAYLNFGPSGGVKIAEIPAPEEPHAPSQCTIHSGSLNCTVVSYAEGVQLAMKSAKAWDLMADLCSKSIVYSFSSAAHFSIRPMALAFQNKDSNGCAERTLMW